MHLQVVLEGIHTITEASQKKLTEEKKREKIQLSKFAQGKARVDEAFSCYST